MARARRGRGEWSFTQRKDGLWTSRKQFGNLNPVVGENVHPLYQQVNR